MIRTLAAFAILAGSIVFAGGPPAGGGGRDGAETGMGSVVGLQNPEDLVQLGDTRWLIASGLLSWTEDPASRGHIYLVDRLQRSFEVLFPARRPVFRHDKAMFPDCPGPIDPQRFSAHGLALKPGGPGRYRLYMTSHGAREAIEVFDIDARGARPAIAWVGCVPVPDGIWGNSLAVLRDGGFVMTKSRDSAIPDAFDHLVEGRPTGQVFEWHPGGTLQPVPGTDLSGPNGIAISPDGRWVFVAAMGSREVVRFDRRTPDAARETVAVPIYPDNIHWGDDGLLYTVGRNHAPQADGKNCPRLNCGTGWSIVKIDPATLAVERVAGADGTAVLGAPSAVITAGDAFWIGTFDGDRIGYLARTR